jgi:hypothetical protein
MATRTKSESRFFTQIALVTVVVVGVVAGVTFVAQYHSTATSQKPGPDPAPVQVDLSFPKMRADWDPPSTSEFETHTPGWYDFWFTNTSGKTVAVEEVTKSCKCQSVQIGFFTGDQKDRYMRWAVGSAASEIGIMTAGLLPLFTQMDYDQKVAPDLRGAKVAWHTFESNSDRLLIPPQASGIVRASWDGKRSKIGPERLTISFWTQSQQESPTPRTPVQLEVPLAFVPALRFSPATVDYGEVGLREEKVAQVLVWSSTRAAFELKAREKTNDPCISCSWQPLNEDQRRSFTEQFNGVPVRSGYLVQVRVKERQSDDKQMDLGPFNRRIVVQADEDIGEESVPITGTVRGEVVVGTEEDKGKVALKSFRARTGTSAKVLVRAQVPGLTLRQEDIRIEPESLNYLKVRLEPVGRNWLLHVNVPADSPPGKLPDHSAILLKIPTSSPRYIRIPISGIAYQQ